MKSDDKTVNLEVAEVLRRLRNRTDMKAEDVGKLIGRSKQTISAWETGKASPDASKTYSHSDLEQLKKAVNSL